MPEDKRGREFVATGRGGAGNMTRSPSRGRPLDKETIVAQQAYAQAQTTVHAGRGGAGNVRSPSRDPVERAKVQEAEISEARIQVAALEKEKRVPHSTGRGGAGNVKASAPDASEDRGRSSGGVGGAIRSLSRSRSREPRASSGTRAPTTEQQPGLAAVDEHNAAGANGYEANGHKPSLVSKIASHLPGHHHHA